MRKYIKRASAAFLLTALLTGCSTSNSGLSDSFVEGLKSGEIDGTPLTLNHEEVLADVKDAWGTPFKVEKYEDLTVYVYEVGGTQVKITENTSVEHPDFYYTISLDVSKFEIAKAMKDFKKTLETDSILQYTYNGHKIQFEEHDGKWHMHLSQGLMLQPNGTN